MSLLDPNAPANVALKQIFSGVDKLKAMGFKKKNIFKMIFSPHRTSKIQAHRWKH